MLNPGELRRRDNTLQIISFSGEKRDIPIETVYDIYCFTDINFNADVIEFLGAKGICLHFFNYYEYYSGSFYAREKLVSGELLVRQVCHYVDLEKRNRLAKKFVSGSAGNILRNLKYYSNRGKVFDSEIKFIESELGKLDFCNQTNEIMGLEGNIRKKYYSAWTEIIDDKFSFIKRVKQPPDNEINTLISFLNSVTYAKILSEIYKTQLNPTISYLHEPSTKRFSLALDVSEIFKPLIVDRLIFSAINKQIITEDDFDQELEALTMRPATVKNLLKDFDLALSRTIFHRSLNREVSYRQLIRLELYKLIKHFLGDKEYSPFKIWW